MSENIRDCITRMTGYVPGEQPTDPDIIKLNTNENPYPPSPRVTEALRNFDPVRLRMYPDPVSLRLRTRIAEMHNSSPAQVFACNGSDEVLALCTRAFVEDSGTIGYFNPSYSLYPVLAEIRNVAVRPVELPADFTWVRPPDDAASLFFMTYPNAPTGIRYPKADVEAFCRAQRGVVVIDEAYVDFADDNCADLALRYDNVLVARTLSKSFSLAGLRVAYAIGSPRLIEALFKIKDSYNLDGISQTLALAALNDPDHMRSQVARIRATRGRLTAALAGLAFDVSPSETNFLWVRPHRMAARALFEALKARGIYIRYFSAPRTSGFVRITIGTDPEIDALLAAIQDILKGYAK